MGKYRYNRYRDLEIDVSRLQFDDEESFHRVIKYEYDKWADKLYRSRERFTAVMWLNVPIEIVKVVPWLVYGDLRFKIHHANSTRVMLVRTHPDSKGTSQIPSYGTHYVKVECVVLEDTTGRILMVKERIGTDSTLKHVSGSVDAGEFFADAAIREVREETGIICRFGCFIGTGNRVRTRFDRDEIIMGCLLFAAPDQRPRADGSEVSVANWFDPLSVIQTCTPMAREWMTAAHACNPTYITRFHTTDIFRGQPYTMDFFIPRLVQQQNAVL